jgi:hypothetical protein
VPACLAGVLAGEEGEPKGQPPGPPAQALGGTSGLRARARRCLWACAGGTPERRRLQKALQTWAQRARQRPAVRLVPAGERRDGHRLVERGQALGNQGQPGRPQQTCTRGVHVRVQHTGAQAQKTGSPRPQDPSPWQAQPAPARPMAATDSQAPQAAAFLRALRRTWAPGRRTPPREAKAPKGWQRL